MADLKQAIKEQSRRLGFVLAGVTSPDSPSHFEIFEDWLARGLHGTMAYLATARSRERRADPRRILPECKSILVLGIPCAPPSHGGIAAYAQGHDYHEVLPRRLQALVDFIEAQAGHAVPHRYYTDTGPLLERELAQRAGLGWVGRNSCLIHPRRGSSFLLAEILLGIDLEPDDPFPSDHCGSCTRCLEACPTSCILPDRTLDARRCISYLTIELREDIPQDLRPLMQDWVFGCDVCQAVCPWNRFAPPPDPELAPRVPLPVLPVDLRMDAAEFNRRFRHMPIKRTKRRGYLRNLAVASGNRGDVQALPHLKQMLLEDEPMIREHARWAIERIQDGRDEA